MAFRGGTRDQTHDLEFAKQVLMPLNQTPSPPQRLLKTGICFLGFATTIKVTVNFCLACLAEDRTQGFCMLGKCSSTERHPDPLGELLMATAAVELLLFSSMFFYYKYSISLSQASSSQF